MASWFSATEIQVGLIGVGSALLTILLKDVGIHFWKEWQTDRKSAKEIYRNYADPLLSASESLFWRLRETLTQVGRGAYLKTSGAENYFDKYKFESTLFRLAILIGWIRAYRRELTFFSLSSGGHLKPLKSAISDFEAALADGAHLEEQRVTSVSELWNIPVPREHANLSRIAVRVEQLIKSVGAATEGDGSLLVDLDHKDQITLCRSIADVLCEEARIDPISTDIISETLEGAIKSLSIREAWLYRDFQSGIGDLVIKEVDKGKRRFDVIGFREFEALLHSNDSEIERWVTRITRVFSDLDISGADRFDARLQMVERMFLAIIDLLLALASIDKGRGSLSKHTLFEAKRLKADTTWRKSVG